MNIEPRRACPSCGNEFAGVMEICPVCTFRKALAGDEVGSDEPALEFTVESSPARGPRRFAHYELVSGQDGKPLELGRGAMGVTYKAFDVNLHDIYSSRGELVVERAHRNLYRTRFASLTLRHNM